MQCGNGTKVSGLFMADLCWAGSYPAVKRLWLPYTHDAKIFLGILVSVISFVYMQHSSECCDIQVSSEIQSTAWSHFSTLSSLWDLRDSSQSKKIGPRSLPAINFPMPPLFRGYVIPLHGNLHGNRSGLSGVNVFYKSLFMSAFHLFNNFALG